MSGRKARLRRLVRRVGRAVRRFVEAMIRGGDTHWRG